MVFENGYKIFSNKHKTLNMTIFSHFPFSRVLIFFLYEPKKKKFGFFVFLIVVVVFVLNVFVVKAFVLL